MIEYETYLQIKRYHEQRGLTAEQIARELNIDGRTVKRWLEEKQFRQRKDPKRSSKLDPFKDTIIRMIELHPYSAIQILQKISQEGFDGGYTIVKDYVRRIRPKKSKAFLKLSFAPGECAQVDWGSFGSVNVGSTRRRLNFFVMVLCYSRKMYVEFTVSQSMEHFLGCHQNAFKYLGIPEKIMVDNLKCAVIKRITGLEPVFNPKYVDFARYYGFEIKPCAVGKGNEKGIVENGVGYVKKNFLSGLDIPDFKVLGHASMLWLNETANVRIHGETRKKPIELFEEEKAHLSCPPPHPYDIATVSQVRASRQFRVTIDTNRYSVPAEYAGANLTLKAYPDRICFYDQEKLIARHVRSYDRHQDIENPDHPKELLAKRKKARDQKIYIRFLSLSPMADSYYKELEQRRMNPRHHIIKIVGLSEIYGADAVARAMEDAFTFQAFSSEYIANLLEQRRRIPAEPGALHVTRREDLLDIDIETPDIAVYNQKGQF